MGMKRKLVDDASVHCHSVKQMKLIPFPSSEPSSDIDMDVPMSDDPIIHFDIPSVFHSRLPSSASTDSDYSSDASDAAPAYPIFNIYPASESAPHTSVNGRAFSGLGFPHLRSDCKQLPKLRVACGAGPTGQRSMWGLCEECGAIQILDS